MSDLQSENNPEFEVQRMLLIESLRIYDVLLALLKTANAAVAEELMAKHAKFEYIGPLPFSEE